MSGGGGDWRKVEGIRKTRDGGKKTKKKIKSWWSHQRTRRRGISPDT
jgi:hypothetical protein